jgi:pimeloyl-ACP methyl ester carboxylesterase
MAERLARAIPGARKVVIPRAGHSSPIEIPEAVNGALDAFLEEAAG